MNCKPTAIDTSPIRSSRHAVSMVFGSEQLLTTTKDPFSLFTSKRFLAENVFENVFGPENVFGLYPQLLLRIRSF